MLDSDYVFSLSIRDTNGRLLHDEDLQNPSPCYEDLLFSGVRTGGIQNDGKAPDAFVEPVWMDQASWEVSGLRVSLAGTTKTYDRSVFSDRVWQVAATKEFSKQVKTFSWRVNARKRQDERKRLHISLSREPYAIARSSLAQFGVKGPPRSDDPCPFLVSRSVADELRHETANSLDEERASILAGYLVRGEGAQVAVVVTGAVPARDGVASSQSHFAFSPITFMAAQKEIDDRHQGETVVGWSHNHPVPCGSKCLQYVPTCKTNTLFFSIDDRTVHRESFPAAYMVALVGGKEAERRVDDPALKAFGWQDGVVREKAFDVF